MQSIAFHVLLSWATYRWVAHFYLSWYNRGMAKARKGQDNLIPQNKRTKDEQREIARKGGIASGKARKEKALLSEMYGAMLAGTFNVEIDGEMKKMTGKRFLTEVVQRIIMNGDSASVAMLKEIREATEGTKNKHEISGGAEPIKVTWQK